MTLQSIPRSRNAAFASLALALLFLLAGPVVAAAQEPVGRVLLARGTTLATAGDGSSRELARRAEVFQADVLETGPGSALQVRFTDGALLSLRAATRVELTVYRHRRPAEGPDKVLLKVLAGGVRTITGAVGADPFAYEVRTPVASIGIRGTHYETVQESETAWIVGLWDGGVRVYNEYGAVNLGRDAEFLFARTELGQAPQGLKVAPQALSDATAGSIAAPIVGAAVGGPGDARVDPREEQALRATVAAEDPVTTTFAGDASGGSSDPGGGAGSGSADGAAGPAGSGAPAGALGAAAVDAGAWNGPGDRSPPAAGDVDAAINPSEGVAAVDDFLALRERTVAERLELSPDERASFTANGRQAVLLLPDGRVVTGQVGAGDDGGRLVLFDGPGLGSSLLRADGATVAGAEDRVGGLDVSWGTLLGGTGASLVVDDGTSIERRQLAEALTFLDLEPADIATLTVQSSYVGDRVLGTTSAGDISSFGVFFDADLDLGTGAISEGLLLLEAGGGLEEYRVNFGGAVRGGIAELDVLDGIITGTGLDGTLDVDRDASALGGLFTDGGEGFAGGFSLQEAGNADRFARGGFVAEKQEEVGAMAADAPSQ